MHGTQEYLNHLDVMIHVKPDIIMNEINITSLDRLQMVETENKRKYDALVNRLGADVQ